MFWVAFQEGQPKNGRLKAWPGVQEGTDGKGLKGEWYFRRLPKESGSEAAREVGMLGLRRTTIITESHESGARVHTLSKGIRSGYPCTGSEVVMVMRRYWSIDRHLKALLAEQQG